VAPTGQLTVVDAQPRVRGIDADWPLSNELPYSAGVVLHLEQLYLD